mmetsp:Transcript_3929/g.9978  ORF Transcript_3929/g.9978 Transcript_3929/m.9978 type:complete len:302 (-) Transcript_3929:256-1161(-)
MASPARNRHAWVAALLLCALPCASTLRTLRDATRSPLAQTRRDAFRRVAGSALAGVALGGPLIAAAAPFALIVPPGAPAAAAAVEEEDFGELPPQSVRAFKQYRPTLQFTADYFIFELHDLINDVSNWPDIEGLMRSASANGQGQPSTFARIVLIPMQQIALAFPPDVSDELADAKNEMERSLLSLIRATRLTNAAVSTGAEASQVADAEKAWQSGRLALNKFYALVDTAVGRPVMTPIPKTEEAGFVRSRQRYTQFKKGLAICQNRGGTNLAGVWGGLMVYGTAVDPCGDMPTVEAYLGL